MTPLAPEGGRVSWASCVVATATTKMIRNGRDATCVPFLFRHFTLPDAANLVDLVEQPRSVGFAIEQPEDALQHLR